MIRYGMVIDLGKCIGCQACTLACKVKNGTRPGIFWSWVLDEEAGEYPAVRRSSVPKLCMHCLNPPCRDACPTGATYKQDDGLVLIDSDKCVGCRYCMLACPYGARSFNEREEGYFGTVSTPPEEAGCGKHRRGVVEKCDFCLDLLAEGQEPACVRACPPEARYFGNLLDPGSGISQLIRARHGFQLLRELGSDASIYYLPVGTR